MLAIIAQFCSSVAACFRLAYIISQVCCRDQSPAIVIINLNHTTKLLLHNNNLNQYQKVFFIITVVLLCIKLLLLAYLILCSFDLCLSVLLYYYSS